MAPRRLPLSAVLAATALALAASVGVLTIFGGDGDEGAGSASAEGDGTEGYELAPAGELPASTADVRLVSLDGAPDRRLGELLGTRPVVVNFFASWCAPCIEEMPAIERVHQALGDQVGFVGMATRDDPADARATVSSTGVGYPTFADPETSALTYFGGLAMPTTVFIDAAGEVVDVHSGAITEDELRSKIDDLFGVPA